MNKSNPLSQSPSIESEARSSASRQPEVYYVPSESNWPIVGPLPYF